MPHVKLSEQILDLDAPLKPPKFIQGIKPVPKAKRAQPVPKMKPLRSSQIAAAVIDCVPLIPRSRMAEIIEPYSSYLAADLKGTPEPDPDGEPNEQFYYSYKVLSILSLARNCYSIEDDTLAAAIGQECGHFTHFEKHSSVRYSP